MASPLVADCMVFVIPGNPVSASSAAFDGTTLTFTPTFSSPVSSYGETWISISALVGKTLTITSSDFPKLFVNVYTCDGVLIETINATSPVTTSAFASDGEYLVSIIPFDPGAGTSSSDTLTIISSGTWWVNPVIALWDDSGTTRQLEACPKMLIPLSTESSGDWFADCAAAASYMTSNVIDCLVVEEVIDSTFDSGSATGGTSLATDATVHNNSPFNSTNPHVLLHASINLMAGESVDIAYNVTGDGNEPADNFSFLATISAIGLSPSPSAQDTGPGATPISGTKTFATFSGFPPTPTTWLAPYTGRYDLTIDVIGARKDSGGGVYVAASLTGTFTITSTGAMSANPVQARYDAGLTCPALLNCGDTCP